MLTKTGIKIDLVECEPLGSLPDVTNDPEHNNNGDSEASHEKVSGIAIAFLACGADGGKKLATKNGEAKGKTEPRAPDTSSSPERDLLKTTTLTLPCPAETDMGLGIWVSMIVQFKVGGSSLTKQIEPQVNRAARAETARSQLNTRLPEDASTM
jgi:hypothetical protein